MSSKIKTRVVSVENGQQVEQVIEGNSMYKPGDTLLVEGNEVDKRTQDGTRLVESSSRIRVRLCGG